MYELKKIERYSRVNLLGPDPRLMKKIIYRAAVAQRLRNTALDCTMWRVRIGRGFGPVLRQATE